MQPGDPGTLASVTIWEPEAGHAVVGRRAGRRTLQAGLADRVGDVQDAVDEVHPAHRLLRGHGGLGFGAGARRGRHAEGARWSAPAEHDVRRRHRSLLPLRTRRGRGSPPQRHRPRPRSSPPRPHRRRVTSRRRAGLTASESLRCRLGRVKRQAVWSSVGERFVEVFSCWRLSAHRCLLAPSRA